MTENGEEKHTGEKLWEATRKTLHSAGQRAGQYKRVVQKKIDLNAVHKKIAALHGDLGRLIDDRRAEGEGDLLARDEVQDLLHRLDGLKHAAATLEEEIEAIRAEQAATEESPPDGNED